MKKLLGLSAVTILLLSFAGIASAQVIVSGQFVLYNALAPTDVAGAMAVPNWTAFVPANNNDDSDSATAKTLGGTNLAGYNATTLTNVSTGIGANLSYDAQFESDDANNQSTDHNNYVLLRASYFTRRNNDDVPLTGLNLTLTGLASTDTYSLYVYLEPPTWGSPSSATITDGTQTFTNITTDKNLTALTQITGSNTTGNYVVFTNISGAPGSVNVSIPGSNFVGITGFQLVDVGTATPEPSTVWLMGLGLAGMAFFVQRKRRA